MQQKLRVVVLLFLPFLFCDARKGTLPGAGQPIKDLNNDARKETLPGAWQQIKDLNGPHVREVAEFAVSEFNKQWKGNLKLERVVKGEMQVVVGINYKLDVMVDNGIIDEAKVYEAVVWEKAGHGSNNLTLTSFKPILG